MLTNEGPMINKKGTKIIQNDISQVQIQMKYYNRAYKTENNKLHDLTEKKIHSNKINNGVSHPKY